MYSLLLTDESFANGYKPEFINIISQASVLSGIFVIISKNPIVSVLFLIGLFMCITCYLFVLGLNFIGLSYLLVYVGAVSILFLFILMLINVRISELLIDTNSSIPLAIVITMSFNYLVYYMLPVNVLSLNVTSLKEYFVIDLGFYLNQLTINPNISDYLYLFFNPFSTHHSKQVLLVTSEFWEGSLVETTYVSSIGNIMYTSYCIWLIITSIVLLLAMVGAIVITIKQRD